MKIVHVLLGKADPDLMGGINKVVHNLATEQIKLNYNVSVWGITDTPEKIIHKHNYKLKLFLKKRNRFSLSKLLVECISNTSTDTIFHLHSSFRPEIYAVSRHLRLKGLSWVLTPHGGYTPTSLKKSYWFKKFYRFLFESKIIKGACAIQSLGEPVSIKGVSYKVGVVPNGYELLNTYKQQYVESGALNICFCGRLEKYYKGLDLLFEALVLLKQKQIDIRLNLIGDGPDMKFLQDFSNKNNLSHIVTFSGSKTGKDKYNLILQNDVFILTSRSEGLPTGVLEAASMAIPLIVTKPTNMANYIRSSSAGYVIKKLTADNISNAIQTAYLDKKTGILAYKGKSARKMIKKSFLWPKIAMLMDENIYSKVKVCKK